MKNLSKERRSSNVTVNGFKGEDATDYGVLRPTVPEGNTELRVMSFNIEKTLPTDDNGTLTDAAKNRIEAVKNEILLYSPDLLGVQEDLGIWHDNLALDGYKVIRDTTIYIGDEQCAIFYKSGLNLITAKTVWMSSNGKRNGVALTVADLFEEGGKYGMSREDLAILGITKDTPDSFFKELKTIYVDKNGVTRNSSKQYAYLGTRKLTYGVFEINGRYVIYVNTHLQNRSQNAIYSNEALQKLRSRERVKHFDMLQAIVDELKEIYTDAVVFVTGDFNDVPETEVYNNAFSHGYSCASVVAQERTGNSGTWNLAYNVKTQGDDYPHEADGSAGDTLDYCFVDQNITVQKFSVGAGKAAITAVDGSEKTIYTSDHLPIVTDICFTVEGLA